MCLGVPGRVVSTLEGGDVRMAKVDLGGVSRDVCVEHVPDVKPGEYVIVHVGFALCRLDEQEAQRVFALLAELGLNDEEGAPS
jgi:hydrogenase expression/formation protein HypC